MQAFPLSWLLKRRQWWQVAALPSSVAWAQEWAPLCLEPWSSQQEPL